MDRTAAATGSAGTCSGASSGTSSGADAAPLATTAATATTAAIAAVWPLGRPTLPPAGRRRRVAVIGSGISGLGAAWSLTLSTAGQADVVLYEADHRFGGHAHTVDLSLDGVRHGVDTGFLVFNHATYPLLRRLFETLDVATAPSDMSFSVQLPAAAGGPALEWSGCNLDTVFAQRGNLLRPSFWSMLRDLLRFNRLTTAIAERGEEQALAQPLGEFLDANRFGQPFRQGYLLPMLACIWSCPTDQMLAFPVATMIRFCHNHGLIRVSQRPPWYTVQGGSREYVRRLVAMLPDARAGVPVRAVRRVPPVGSAQQPGAAGVWVDTDQGSERYDAVVLATHSPQALRLLGAGATADERAVLGALRTHRNRAVLHTDTRLLPTRPKAWAAWNYERAAGDERERGAVCLHYLINRLQPLPWQRPVIVSLNPVREPAADQVHGEFDVAHPVFDAAAIDAQRRLPALQGVGQVWFAGAWGGYGFHEDGLRSGLAAAAGVVAHWAADLAQPAPARAAAQVA